MKTFSQKLLPSQPVMRILSSIMFMLVMVLQLAPCADLYASNRSQQQEIIVNAATHHQDKHDVCSPFCYCACCAVPVVVNTPINFVPDSPTCFAVCVTHLPGKYIDVSLPVWQPPQLLS
ncbi:MAG: hypothetical protein EPN37_01545 [Chitinophagaceae bacterium]|nr:MAG: hypothetical protein EPN37_01545 [Chitinophagaceae bacterium]